MEGTMKVCVLTGQRQLECCLLYTSTFSFLCLAIAVICGMINFMTAGSLDWFWFAGAGCALSLIHIFSCTLR